MPNPIDITGKRYGRLIAIRPIIKSGERRKWECKCDCGNIVRVVMYDLRRGHTSSCGCYRLETNKRSPGRGLNNSNWKGGRIRAANYIKVYNPKHLGASSGGYVYEHRLVMERKLGRFLGRSEQVHHIDGDSTNNNINNLHLFKNAGYHMQWHRRLEEISTYD